MSKNKLIKALNKTATDLDNGCNYEWGHMGRCNAGCLVQNLTNKTDKEIAKMVNFEIDEWSEHANDYCHGTNENVNELFDSLKQFGLSYQDMMHIEYLSDPKVLSHLPDDRKHLQKNNPKDVSAYMRCFAKELALN